MKITEVQLIECLDLDHRNHVQSQEVVNNEKAMVYGQWPLLKSMENKLGPTHLPNTPRTPSPSTSSPSSMVKRKMSEVLKDGKFLAKKKKLSSPNSKHEVSVYARKSISCKREKATSKGLNTACQVKSPTMIRAEEVQASLGTEFPSFVKLMVRSHVSSSFWMRLPSPFCKLHLPEKDAMVILEDESGEQFEAKLIAYSWGLSGGWRGFATGHKLLEGDVLVFQLVEAIKFKVFVIRAKDLTDVDDGDLGLLNLDGHSKQSDADDAEDTIALKNKKRKFPISVPFAVVQKRNRKTDLPSSASKLTPPIEVQVQPKFSGPALSFKDIKRFEDFKILINGVCIDSELSEHIRIKYYELCCSENAFLHARLLNGLSCMLVSSIIFEIVNISDAIRACKLTTTWNEFEIWGKALKSFELLGMNVGFLCARLCRLRTLSFESEGASVTKRYIEAKAELLRAEDEIRDLEAKLVDLKGASDKFAVNVETLKSEAESHELKFQEEVDAPW